jgi:hypothetical protein
MLDDGTEFDCQPGDVSLLPSGHDAWTAGNEPAVVIYFQGMIMQNTCKASHGAVTNITEMNERG